MTHDQSACLPDLKLLTKVHRTTTPHLMDYFRLSVSFPPYLPSFPRSAFSRRRCQDLVGKLFKGFLFTMPEQRGRGMSVERPVCADPATRRAALHVLASASRKSPKAMSVLLDNVRHTGTGRGKAVVRETFCCKTPERSKMPARKSHRLIDSQDLFSLEYFLVLYFSCKGCFARS